MNRIIPLKKFGGFLFALVLLQPAFLLAGPCEADMSQYCHDQPGMGTMMDCMETNRDQFTYECRQWLKKMDRAIKKIATACSFDARNFCQDLQPTYDTVSACLNSNLDKLSMECQNALQEKNQ